MRQEPSGTLPQIGAARAKYVKFHQRSHPVATFLPDVPTQVQLNVSVTLAGSLRIARKRSILRCGCSSPGVGSGLRRVNKVPVITTTECMIGLLKRLGVRRCASGH